MKKQDYEFVRSYIGKPIMSGLNSSQPMKATIQYFQSVRDRNGLPTVVIEANLHTTAIIPGRQVSLKGISSFRIIGDAENIVVPDIYDMCCKAFEDLCSYLKTKIDPNYLVWMGLPIPSLQDVLDESIKVVTTLHSKGK